jgi:phage-related protein
MPKKVIYYEDLKGRKYVKDFINGFEEKTRGKILARIEFLGEHWNELRRPIVDKIDRDLYELRVQFAWNNVRVIYAYMFNDHIVLLHGLVKKTDALSERDILKAKKRLADFQIRYDRKMIRLK